MNNNPYDKRILKGEQTRTSILYAAIDIIANEGIREISAAKIASVIGVSKSNVFHHFKTIDEIIYGVYNIIFEELLVSLDTEYRSLEEFLNTLGQSIFDIPEKEKKIFKAFFSFYHEGMFNLEYQKLLSSSTEQIIKFLYTQLNRLTSNSTKQEDLQSVAIILLSMMDGMGLHYLLNGDKEDYKFAWSIQVQLLCKFLS